MKIAISYPPIESKKGTPLLSQNRQFQWFNSPTYIYPMVPAYAASLLKEKGYDVFWDDGIAEKLTYQQWKERILEEKPDIIAIETKTPVVKRHWQIINELKEKSLEIGNCLPTGKAGKLKIVLMGDHVTALPEESLQNSKVDYVLTGGDYDFMLLNLANHLTKGEKLEPGWYFRQPTTDNQQLTTIINTGHFQLNHNLDDLPPVDRELTKWKLYAYDNGDFKYLPGSYLMSGRDCWWGKCTFCVTKKSQVFTINGSKSITEIKKGDNVLTHLGNYRKVKQILHRRHTGSILEVKPNCLRAFKITPNHRILCLPLNKMSKCKYPNASSYLCEGNEFSKKLKCKDCPHKPYLDYQPEYIEAGKVKKGDFLAVPISREVEDVKYLNLTEILGLAPVILKTKKKISNSKVSQILRLYNQGKSERKISTALNIDRETVHRYIVLEKMGFIENKTNPLVERNNKIKFEGGKSWISAKIKIDEDIFRLFGYYLAEGHVTKLKDRPNSFVLGFTFSKKEDKYIKDVKKIIKNIFRIEPNINYNKKNNTYQITVGNSLLAKVFKNLFGENCYTKHIPEFILKADRNKQIELLKGLFRGDAHLRVRKGRGEYILSTSSDALASQIVLVLLRCSAIPSVRVTKLEKKMTKPQNVISLSSVDIVRIFGNKELELNDKTIYKHGFIVKNYAFLPIVSVKKEEYNGKVYNLSVEKDHSYTVNFIGVSNCSWTTLFPGRHYRQRSARKALDEVGILIGLGVKEIMEDSGSLPIGDWLKEFCNGMIERGYNKKIRLSCNMRINGIKDLETWKLMKKAGFRLILFGLESANQITLDRINKGLKVEEIEPNLKMCKQAGLEPHITTMMGFPWETKSMAQKTIDLAKKLFKKGYVDTLQATILIPYPGTPLYKYCKENNLLRFNDYDRFDQREQVMKSELTTEDVKELTQSLYKSFASPQFIIRKILNIRSLHDIKFLARAGIKLIGHLTDFGKG